MALLLKKFSFTILVILSILTLDVYAQPSITWNKMYPRVPNGEEYSNGICDAGNGNYFVTGYTNSKLYVLKINAYGDTLWKKFYDNYVIAEACVSTGDGGCAIVCMDTDILKIDADGNVVWDIAFAGHNYFDILKTQDGGYLVCGSKNVFDGLILKLTSNGEEVWTKTYSSGFSRTYISVLQTTKGFIGVGITTETNGGIGKALLTHINDTGGVIWEQSFNIISNRYANITNIFKVVDGYIIGGTTGDSLGLTFGNSYIGKINESGQLLYSKVYHADRSEYFQRMRKRNDDRFALTIYRIPKFTYDSTHTKFYVVDALGNIIAQKQLTSVDDVQFPSCIPVNNGDYIFTGASDFIRPGGNSDIHIIRTDSLLNFPQNVFGIQQIGTHIPNEYNLYQNYPNPFNPVTKIRFNIPYRDFVSLKIYDMLGRHVEELINGVLNAGKYETDFNALNLTSGVYFYKLTSKNFNITKKMMYIK